MLGYRHGFEVKEFSAEHIDVSKIRDHEAEFLTTLGDMRPRLRLLENSGPGWSLFKDGEFIAAGGAVPLYGITAELWQFPSKRVPDFTCSYCKLLQELVSGLSDEFERLQTICLNDELHHRWMSFLDFEEEGIMRRYGYDQRDYALFARLS